MSSEAGRTGLRAAGIALGLGLLASAPSRWVLSGLGADAGIPRWQGLALGLGADLGLLGAPCALLGGLCLLGRRRDRLLGRMVLAVAALAIWAFMVSTSESYLSRGIFPTWVDVHILWRSPDMMRASLAMFVMPRNVLPALLVLAPAMALLALWPAPPAGSARLAAAACVGTGVAILVLAHAAVAVFGGHAAAATASPLELFAPRSLPEALGCACGPCEPRVLLHPELGRDPLGARGAAMLGWPSPSAEHGARRFARRWPSDEGAAPAPAPAAALVGALLELSDELFGASEAPVGIWQLVLESVRGDDLHAINPAAPAELAPFLDSLYQASSGGALGIFGSRHTWSAGVRTPHGLGAVTCGLGTLPYGLTLTRDLGPVELRCLPDLLVEAGYAGGYAYGGTIGFDRMGAFLAEHSLAPWVTAAALPPRAPRGSWGASDRTVLAAAVAAAPRQGSFYGLVLSLSGHHPFVEPEDVPAEVLERVARVWLLASERAEGDDRRRLVTLAYTDDALRAFFAELASAGLLERSIVLITADHATPDRPLWRGRSGALPSHQTRAAIPLVLWIAPQWFAAARHPERARELSDDIARQLATTALSQNDVPTLLLALLEQSRLLRALGPEARWHSMGGEVTSPWFDPPGPAGTRIYGLNAATAAYFVDADGAPTAPEEPAPLVVTDAESARVTPSLRPAAAALGELLRTD